MVNCDAIVLGGGLGTRFAETSSQGGSPTPKQFQMIGKSPAVYYPIKTLLDSGKVRHIILTAPSQYLKLADELIAKSFLPSEIAKICIVAGGSTRQESARLALQAIEARFQIPDRVLIHDACRPFLPRTS